MIFPTLKKVDDLLVVAHGNSLRGVIKHLKGISDKDIISLNLPTALPYVFEFDDDLNLVKDYFLGDPEEIKKLQEAVANQGKNKPATGDAVRLNSLRILPRPARCAFVFSDLPGHNQPFLLRHRGQKAHAFGNSSGCKSCASGWFITFGEGTRSKKRRFHRKNSRCRKGSSRGGCRDCSYINNVPYNALQNVGFEAEKEEKYFTINQQLDFTLLKQHCRGRVKFGKAPRISADLLLTLLATIS